MWGSCRPDPDCGLWGIRSSDGGKTWYTPVRLTPRTENVIEGYITQAADGVLWLVWHNLVTLSDKQRHLDVFYSFSTDKGNNWSDAVRLTRFVGWDTYPSVAALGNDVYVAWSSDRVGNADIWFAKLGRDTDDSPPPHIEELGHNPRQPTSNDRITFGLRATSEVDIKEVKLLWLVEGVSWQPREEVMYDDGTHGDTKAGDGWFTATIGPFAAGTKIEYQMRATDSLENR